jgi:hypothetical protein
MNCFNHRERPAIGLCKSCEKALCADCLTEVPHGLACKGSCEARVNLMNRIIDRNSRILSLQGRYIRRHGLLTLLFGLGLVIFAIADSPQFTAFPVVPYFFGFAGCLCAVYGVLTLRRKEQYPNPDEQ